MRLGKVAASPRDRTGSLPVSRKIMVFCVSFSRFFTILSMFRNPVHFCRNSVVMNLVLGSVELTRSDGGMFRMWRGSCRVELIEENAFLSKVPVSKYGEVSCSSYICVRTGSTGGGFDNVVNVFGYVVGHGGYGASIFDSKSVSRDGINLISLFFGAISGTGRNIGAGNFSSGDTKFSVVDERDSMVNVAIAGARGTIGVSSLSVSWFSRFLL